MLDSLLSKTWLVAVIWAAMSIFDYGSTLWLQNAYQSTLNQYMTYEGGVELNPNFGKEIARGQISPKFIALLLLFFLITAFSWLLGGPIAEFLAGALLLTWAFIDMRHLRNYFLVSLLHHRPDSLKGRHEYSYWLLQRLISTDAFDFGLLYGLLAILTGRLFFVGGAIMCLGLTLRHYRLANRKLPSPSA